MRVLIADPQPILRLDLNQPVEGLVETADFIETEYLKETRGLAKGTCLDLALIHIRPPTIAPPDRHAAMMRTIPETLVIVVWTLVSHAASVEMLNVQTTLIAASAAGQFGASCHDGA